MKKLRKVGCILLMALLAGLFANCGGALVLTQAQTNSLISQIHQGTSQEEVLKILGKSNNKLI